MLDETGIPRVVADRRPAGGEARGQRWGSATVPRTAEAARERIVDAALACLDRYGPAKTHVDDVAAAAGVSRRTVYRYFANREELVVTAWLRELESSFRLGIGDFVEDVTTAPALAEALADALAHLLEVVRANPLLLAVMTDERGGAALLLTRAADLLASYFRGGLEAPLAPFASAGLLRAVSLDEAAEWTARAVLSLLTAPSARTPAEEREFLRQVLVPAFVVGA